MAFASFNFPIFNAPLFFKINSVIYDSQRVENGPSQKREFFELLFQKKKFSWSQVKHPQYLFKLHWKFLCEISN